MKEVKIGEVYKHIWKDEQKVKVNQVQPYGSGFRVTYTYIDGSMPYGLMTSRGAFLSNYELDKSNNNT